MQSIGNEKPHINIFTRKSNGKNILCARLISGTKTLSTRTMAQAKSRKEAMAMANEIFFASESASAQLYIRIFWSPQSDYFICRGNSETYIKYRKALFEKWCAKHFIGKSLAYFRNIPLMDIYKNIISNGASKRVAEMSIQSIMVPVNHYLKNAGDNYRLTFESHYA